MVLPVSGDTEATKAEMLQIIDDLVSSEDCWFDHHGYCQAHMWFETEPVCPHARAKELLRRRAAVVETPPQSRAIDKLLGCNYKEKWVDHADYEVVDPFDVVAGAGTPQAEEPTAVVESTKEGN